MKMYTRVQAEVDLDAIRNNIKEVKRVIKPGTKVMAIIKADGYGHGAIAVAHALDSEVSGFGVAAVQEAVNLRNSGIKQMILVLGPTFPEYFDEIVKYDISQTVFTFESARELSDEALRQGKKARVHFAVDTGMGRIGFTDNEESVEVIKKIAMLPGIDIEGIFTHYARADEADKTSVNEQIRRYSNFVKMVEDAGVHIPIHHASNSAGIIDLPESNFDMVRSGITTYGMYPSEEVKKDVIKLTPALRLKSHVTFVKTVPAGCGISYGSTFVTTKETRIATIPVGYADGYPRALSGKGRMLIHGQYAPILGRVCMDQTMVDVSDIPDVKAGDKVILVGREGDNKITVEELAGLAGSFNYEFVCNLSKRVPRTYFENGKMIGSMDYTKDEVNAVEFF